jgi:hypothetical protein
MNIGKAIYKLIGEVSLSGFTPTNVYPNVISSGIEFPAVVYEISEQKPTNTKGFASKTDIFTINLYTYCNDYDLLISISDAIRAKLDNLHTKAVTISQSETITLDSSIFEGSKQGFADDAKVHMIIDTYTIRVKL